MVVPAFLFPLLMIVGALLLTTAALQQSRLMRASGLAGPAKVFNVKDYEADQKSMAAMRATSAWKRMRLMLGTGAFLMILGALLRLPDLLR